MATDPTRATPTAEELKHRLLAWAAAVIDPEDDFNSYIDLAFPEACRRLADALAEVERLRPLAMYGDAAENAVQRRTIEGLRQRAEAREAEFIGQRNRAVEAEAKLAEAQAKLTKIEQSGYTRCYCNCGECWSSDQVTEHTMKLAEAQQHHHTYHAYCSAVQPVACPKCAEAQQREAWWRELCMEVLYPSDPHRGKEDRWRELRRLLGLEVAK